MYNIHTGTGCRIWIRSGYCSSTYSAALVPDSIAKFSSLYKKIKHVTVYMKKKCQIRLPCIKKKQKKQLFKRIQIAWFDSL